MVTSRHNAIDRHVEMAGGMGGGFQFHTGNRIDLHASRGQNKHRLQASYITTTVQSDLRDCCSTEKGMFHSPWYCHLVGKRLPWQPGSYRWKAAAACALGIRITAPALRCDVLINVIWPTWQWAGTGALPTSQFQSVQAETYLHMTQPTD